MVNQYFFFGAAQCNKFRSHVRAECKDQIHLLKKHSVTVHVVSDVRPGKSIVAVKAADHGYVQFFLQAYRLYTVIAKVNMQYLYSIFFTNVLKKVKITGDQKK